MSALSGKVSTVLGSKDPAQLGITLFHEHLLANPFHAAKPPQEASLYQLYEKPVTMQLLGGLRFGRVVNRDNCRLDDAETAEFEIGLYRQAGGHSIVEATSIGLGRDPIGLARLARATGVNIIMGGSYYVEPMWPAGNRVAETPEEALCDRIVTEVFDGVGDTGIRVGLIGEVGCSWPMTRNEEKVLRASVAAQKATGATLMIHPGIDRRAPERIASIVESAGGDPARTVICHLDRTIDTRELFRDLAERGFVLEFDLFGRENSYNVTPYQVDCLNDIARIRWLQWLIGEGYGPSITISHDVIFKQHLVTYGGAGYAHIVTNVVPLMRQAGMQQAEIDQLLIHTPRRLLTLA
jgi:phosphotriesterase-related protein